MTLKCTTSTGASLPFLMPLVMPHWVTNSKNAWTRNHLLCPLYQLHKVPSDCCRNTSQSHNATISTVCESPLPPIMSWCSPSNMSIFQFSGSGHIPRWAPTQWIMYHHSQKITGWNEKITSHWPHWHWKDKDSGLWDNVLAKNQWSNRGHD